MYKNNKFKKRNSFRPNSFNNSKPQSSENRFKRPNRFSNNNRQGNQRRSQLERADINIFIKKATVNPDNQISNSNISFDDFNLMENLKQNIKQSGYTNPTPIQAQTIIPLLEGKDVIGLASTGTGKTAAFLIPLINKLFKERDQRALIIAPTRELAVQINDSFRKLAYGMHVYSAILIGGANIKRQINDLRRFPQVVIATPGRLKDLINKKAIYLQDYQNIVLDEVDLMVDIGFIKDIQYFISLMPKERQSLFFSATISPKINTILQDFVKDPVTVSVKKQDTSENVNQDVVRFIDPSQKIGILHDLLITQGFDKVLIFLKAKHSVDKLHRELFDRGFKIGSIHGNKSQSQRQRVLQSFKRDDIKILLATDVASRGLDIDNVTHVINYDLPQTYEDYIHRIGRTGRAGKVGTALTFV